MTGNNKIQAKVVGKILLIADIVNQSPMLIASGLNDTADFQLIKTHKGSPFIPASGVAGMLRALKSPQTPSHVWGTDNHKEALFQSHVIIDDLMLKHPEKALISIRDGVEINRLTNTAEKGSKYDYEVLEAGAVFGLKLEITLREGMDKMDYLTSISEIVEYGKAGQYQQGAFKTNGFGQLTGWESAQIYDFDFTEKEQAMAWFAYLESGVLPNQQLLSTDKLPPVTIHPNTLTIEGVFEIHNALIIGSDKAGITLGVDKAQLKNGKGDAIFTAKSARGPIRHRALRILNTIGRADAACIVDNLFGFVNKSTQKAQIGKLKTFESTIVGANDTQTQPRIKIDRFTGGTIESALMQTQPLWHQNENIHLKLEIQDCTHDEAALMLLVMKDAMTADLPFGGEKAIGRGTLKGKSLTFKGNVNEKTYEISFTEKGIEPHNSSLILELNTWIEQLNQPSNGK